MNLDAIGCVWMGEFDLNALPVDGDIFEFRKKKLWIQKYPDSGIRVYGALCSILHKNHGNNLFRG